MMIRLGLYLICLFASSELFEVRDHVCPLSQSLESDT